MKKLDKFVATWNIIPATNTLAFPFTFIQRKEIIVHYSER